MEARSKWLWAVTAANVAVTSLLLLSIFGIMFALALLAPEISSWPLFILLLIGLPLSVTGLRLAKGVVSRGSRRAAFGLNGSAFALDLLVIAGLAAMFLGSTKERFLIPYGYKGDVYVVYGAQDGGSLNKTFWGVTYRIPEDGILRAADPTLPRWTRTEYYYQRQDGSLERIRNFWPTTIDRTPESLADDKDVGVFFPRTGSFMESTGCSVQFSQFYVGTKAHLLSKYRQTDLSSYVHDHPGACSR